MNKRQAREVVGVLTRGTRRQAPERVVDAYTSVLCSFDLDIGMLAVSSWLREHPHQLPTVAGLKRGLRFEYDAQRRERDLFAGPPLDEFKPIGLRGVARARAILREKSPAA